MHGCWFLPAANECCVPLTCPAALPHPLSPPHAHRLRDYLDTMQLHMPPTHRTFIAQLASRGTPVRAAAAAGAPAALQEAYNEVVADMQAFRTQHRAFASSYIAK